MSQLKNTVPALPVVNIANAVAFYENKMGFKARHKEDRFAILVRDNIDIHLWAACDQSWRYKFWLVFRPISNGAESFLAGTASCRIEVQGIDEIYQEFKETGVIYNPETVVEDQPWGHRDFPTLDLYGNLITFFEIISSTTLNNKLH